MIKYLIVQEMGGWGYDDHEMTPLKVVSTKERAKELCTELLIQFNNEMSISNKLEKFKERFQKNWPKKNPYPQYTGEKPRYDLHMATHPVEGKIYQKLYRRALASWEKEIELPHKAASEAWFIKLEAALNIHLESFKGRIKPDKKFKYNDVAFDFMEIEVEE